MNRPLVTIASAGILAVLCGCGYRSDTVFRPNIDTVYVEMFESREFRRDLEFLLTEAVKKRIGTDTPYRLAAPEHADIMLKGEVLEERQNAYAPDFRTRQPRDVQMTMVVRVQVKDLRDGRILVDKPLLLQAVDYLPPAGESEAFAQQKAMDRLAARIVAETYSDW